MAELLDLNVLWFVLIAVLFTGFFFLEGFDYGVGMLLPFISKNEEDRSLLIRSIAPVWDGNEVWMITAGGALFAAFPHVYATMFSSFYLALFLMLLALILRGTGLELRGKHDSFVWKRSFDYAICFGSLLPAFLWGVAVTNLLQGIAINEQMIYQGTFFDLLTPYTIIGGITFLMVFLFHGMVFLRLRLADDALLAKLKVWSWKLGSMTVGVFLLCVFMTASNTDFLNSTAATICIVLAALTFLVGCFSSAANKAKLAFIGSSLAIVFTTAAFFAALFPRLMVSSLNPAWSLTIYNASSTPYTLSIMSIAAICLVPVVLAYQGWTYWIFRRRVTKNKLEQY